MSIHMYSFFPASKHFTFLTTFRPIIEIHFHKADKPGTCHQPLALVVWELGFSALTAVAWLQSLVGETEILLQAIAGRGRPRSEYYSASKRKEILAPATTWMNPEGFMLSERSYIQNDNCCMIPLI